VTLAKPIKSQLGCERLDSTGHSSGSGAVEHRGHGLIRHEAVLQERASEKSDSELPAEEIIPHY